MTHKLNDVLKTLDEFQAKIGFENFTDEDADTIYDAEPFIIKKSEWRRALMLGMQLPKRATGEWWTDFVDLGYLRPFRTEDSKDEQALLNSKIIKRDVEEYYGGIEQYLGGD